MRIPRHRRRIAVLTLTFVLTATTVAQAAPAPPLVKSNPINAPDFPPEQTPRRDPSWWHWSHLIDWGVVLGATAIGAGVNYAKPHQRSFTLTSPGIDHAERAETVPGLWLILTIALPLATIGTAKAIGHGWHDFHHATLGLAEAVGLTLLLTTVLKVSVGRLRPDFLSRCVPDPNLQCTGDPSEEREGRLSFPSGHASLSFAGGTYMSLYLLGAMAPLGGLHWLWKIPVVLLPMAAATYVAWSRVRDRRHHRGDVVAGGLIGFGSAVLGYLVNFHFPGSNKAGKPRRRKRLTVVPVVSTDRVGLAVQGGF